MNDEPDPAGVVAQCHPEAGADVSAAIQMFQPNMEGLGTMLAAIGRAVGGVELDIDRHRHRLTSGSAAHVGVIRAENASANVPVSDDAHQ
jgi:hypothetical protein